MSHLKERWSGLFGASYDILLYDLTSTYFEVDANGPITEASKLKAFGYSRDKRPDCVQIVIALIITLGRTAHRLRSHARQHFRQDHAS